MTDARSLLATTLDVSVDSVPADADIRTFPAWDSLVHLRLMFALEDQLGRKIDPAKAASLFSLRDIDVMLAGAKEPRS